MLLDKLVNYEINAKSDRPDRIHFHFAGYWGVYKYVLFLPVMCNGAC